MDVLYSQQTYTIRQEAPFTTVTLAILHESIFIVLVHQMIPYLDGSLPHATQTDNWFRFVYLSHTVEHEIRLARMTLDVAQSCLERFICIVWHAHTFFEESRPQ